MKHKAKLKGQARHSLGHISAILAGMGVASSSELRAVKEFLEVVGAPDWAMVVAGAVVIAGMHLWSWFSKEKKVGEGDPE